MTQHQKPDTGGTDCPAFTLTGRMTRANTVPLGDSPSPATRLSPGYTSTPPLTAAFLLNTEGSQLAKHVGKDVKKELQAKMTTTSDSPSKGPSGDSSSGNFLKVTVRESHRYSITTEKYFPHSALTPDGFYQSLLPPGLLSPSSTTDSE
ncbi:hypothetical protein MJT46_004567 [Ovis ammon polii x Ovis aries]|nr:hypothetical protein MJT46_004567 [Ovis ammon polii x Ovis aries]